MGSKMLSEYRRVTDRREFFTLAPAAAACILDSIAPARADGAPAAPPPPPPATPPPPPATARCTDAHEKLRAWVDANYTRIPVREKDQGTKLERLYTAYTTAAPPVHDRLLGRNTFAKMLNEVYPHTGPHRNNDGTIKGLYLLG